MKSKKISLNIVIIVVLFIVLIFTIYNNGIFNYGVNFESIYSEVDKLSYETPKKVNTSVEDISFYVPNGYKTIKDDGIFLKSIYSNLNVIPNKLDADNIGENYEINTEYDVVFEHISSSKENDGKFTNMIVWNIGNDMYEILILNDENNAVVGDIKSDYIYQGITDMAYVLNSIKEN